MDNDDNKSDNNERNNGSNDNILVKKTNNQFMKNFMIVTVHVGNVRESVI